MALQEAKERSADTNIAAEAKLIPIGASSNLSEAPTCSSETILPVSAPLSSATIPAGLSEDPVKDNNNKQTETDVVKVEVLEQVAEDEVDAAAAYAKKLAETSILLNAREENILAVSQQNAVLLEEINTLRSQVRICDKLHLSMT